MRSLVTSKGKAEIKQTEFQTLVKHFEGSPDKTLKGLRRERTKNCRPSICKDILEKNVIRSKEMFSEVIVHKIPKSGEKCHQADPASSQMKKLKKSSFF